MHAFLLHMVRLHLWNRSGPEQSAGGLESPECWESSHEIIIVREEVPSADITGFSPVRQRVALQLMVNIEPVVLAIDTGSILHLTAAFLEDVAILLDALRADIVRVSGR